MTRLSRPENEATTFRCRRVGSSAGFTLTELMVVILIISIMSALVLTGFSGGGGQDLDAGVSRWTNVFTLAQSAALTRKTPVRVAISYDPSDEEHFLRYANLFFYDEDDDAWKPMSEGEFLPTGIYFSPALSTPAGIASLKLWEMNFDFDDFEVVSSAGFLRNLRSTLTGDDNDRVNRAGLNEWVVYEFAPNGTAENPGARMVLAQGLLASGELVIPNRQVADGFTIFRSGRPYHFQDPEQIEGR